MTTLMMHLNKNSSVNGWASKSACGRNLLRTNLSVNWNEFLNTPQEHRCDKCSNSKQAALNAKTSK